MELEDDDDNDDGEDSGSLEHAVTPRGDYPNPTEGEIRQAACRWIRDICGRQMEAWPIRRFRVRAFAAKGSSCLEGGTFTVRNPGYKPLPKLPPPVEVLPPPALVPATIPTPTFQQAPLEGPFAGYRALGDYYAQFGQIMLGGVNQLQTINGTMLGGLSDQLRESRGQVDELVAAILNFRVSQLEQSQQREQHQAHDDKRTALARDTINQLGDVARAFLTSRGIPPELAEVFGTLGSCPELMAAMGDPNVRELLRDPRHLQALASMLRQIGQQYQAMRGMSGREPPQGGAAPSNPASAPIPGYASNLALGANTVYPANATHSSNSAYGSNPPYRSNPAYGSGPVSPAYAANPTHPAYGANQAYGVHPAYGANPVNPAYGANPASSALTAHPGYLVNPSYPGSLSNLAFAQNPANPAFAASPADPAFTPSSVHASNPPYSANPGYAADPSSQPYQSPTYGRLPEETHGWTGGPSNSTYPGPPSQPGYGQTWQGYPEYPTYPGSQAPYQEPAGLRGAPGSGTYHPLSAPPPNASRPHPHAPYAHAYGAPTAYPGAPEAPSLSPPAYHSPVSPDQNAAPHAGLPQGQPPQMPQSLPERTGGSPWNPTAPGSSAPADGGEGRPPVPASPTTCSSSPP